MNCTQLHQMNENRCDEMWLNLEAMKVKRNIMFDNNWFMYVILENVCICVCV